MQINFQYSIYYLFAIAIVAIAMAVILYINFAKRYETSRPIVFFLSALRSIAIFSIGFLLLVPFVRLVKSQLEKPVIAIGLDNSQSISLSDTITISKVKKAISSIESDLADIYDVETFIYGDDVLPGEWDLTAKKSNISSWFHFVTNQYKHSNLAGVVTVSDGIFNAGGNPIYSGYQLNAPLYNIAVGDTNVPIDARIAFVNHNDIAYKGNQFPIKSGIAVEKLKGKSLELQLFKEGKLLNTERINVTSDDFFGEYGFLVNADKTGIQQYELRLTEFEGELSILNNSQKVFVEVIDADKNILIAYNAPHPDIGALRRSIERNRNYKVDLWWVNDPNKENKVSDYGKYHLVIMHNLPQGNTFFMKPLLQSKVSKLYIIDDKINFRQFNKDEALANLDLKSTVPNQASAAYHKNFVGYSLNTTQMARIEEYPPLNALFGNVSFTNSSDILLFQKIGNVVTNYPLLSISQSSNQKIGVLTATGIWRWFLHEYAENDNYEGLDELFNQTIQYLSVKEDKRRLRLSRNRFLFNENEDVVMSVSFYNKNYEPAIGAEIVVNLRDEEGADFQFKFLPKGSIYEMNAGQLPIGTYEYSIAATLGDDKHTLNGKLTVAEVNIEYMQPVANHNLLYQLANQNEGELFYANNLDKLKNMLLESNRAKPIRHEKAEITELIHEKWLFILILIALTVEWILRKYKGAY
ncbi:MAG: hypothetical protein JXQ87_08715 [Bacteroidia bacterium]